MTYFVVVNRHRVKANERTTVPLPVFRVSSGKYGAPKYGARVELPAGAVMVYDPANPMPCGARVWLEAPEVILS